MRAISIDFDGVLHRAGAVHEKVLFFEWLPVLERLLEPWPDVYLVVHSTWRYTHTPDELRDLLGALQARFLGCVPRGPRAEAILWFLSMNRHLQTVLVVDDAKDEFPSDFEVPVVYCDPHVGLSASNVQAQISHWLSGTSSSGDSSPGG